MLIIHNGNEIEPLQYYKDLQIKTRVNGERSLSFILLSTDSNYSLVETGAIIEYNGQQYRIFKTDERSKGSNSVKSIQCLHVLFDLIDNDVGGALNGEQTLNQVLSFLLRGTSYTFDIVDSFNSVTLEAWGEDNSLALFQDALNLFGAEFDVDNTHITLKQQIGNDTDFQFRFKHNIKTIEKSVEKVTGGVNLSIKLSFAELKKAGYPYEVVNCGDTVFTIYEPMNINITNRIVEYTEYPSEPKESTVTLSNYQDNITDIIADLGNTQKRFNKVVDGNNKVRFNVLDDATQRATTALNNALTELEFPENLGIIARDPNDANRFVVLKSNGIGITTDGGQTFKEAITADGFVLSAGAIGQLSANNIKVGSATTFDTDYDPSTKETPTGAQSKADSAESNAKSYTDNKLLDYVDVVTYDTDIDSLQSQIDGNITSWFYDYDPTLSNEPASNWTTDTEKDKHLGDTFYNRSSGYAWRFSYDSVNVVYEWASIKDTDVQKALNDASTAQDTADSKRRVFTTTPTTPYDVGDLWTEGTNGDLKRCITAKTSSQSYNSADWEKAVKYTDDTKANEADEKATSAKNLTDAWVYPDTTEIDGGNIRTGTVTAEILRTSNNGILVSEVYKDANGGMFKIYDNDGNLNAKIGAEAGTADNVGGTLILYNKAIENPRVQLGIDTTLGSGTINLKDDAGNVKAVLYANSSMGSAVVGLLDDAGNLISYLSETGGKINGDPIITQSVANQDYVKDRMLQDLQLQHNGSTGRIDVWKGTTLLGELAWHV